MIITGNSISALGLYAKNQSSQRQVSSAEAATTADTATSTTKFTLSSEGKRMALSDLTPIDMSSKQITVPDSEELRSLMATIKQEEQNQRSRYSESGISNYEQQLIKQGNQQQTAVIKLDGQVVGSFSDQGSFFSSNAMGALVSSANGDQNAMAATLKAKYGSRIEIQTFAPGQGPTYAQVEKSIYGTDYFSRIPQAVADFRKEATSWLSSNSQS